MDINAELSKRNASSRYGAQMGRRGQVDNPEALVHLQRVQFVDGDYDRGGAYWGGGRGVDPLYCAMGDAGDALVFIRAKSREEAKAEILDQYPDLKFYR